MKKIEVILRMQYIIDLKKFIGDLIDYESDFNINPLCFDKEWLIEGGNLYINHDNSRDGLFDYGGLVIDSLGALGEQLFMKEHDGMMFVMATDEDIDRFFSEKSPLLIILVRMRNNWDIRFITMADTVATWSKDKNKKTGAVVVNKDKIVLAMGYNGFPRGCDDSIECRYERPYKYFYTEHAERNAIYNAAKQGLSLNGATMYATYFPCADCARAIIQSGIIKVVAPTPDVEHETWGEHFKAALCMFDEAGVEVDLFE